MVYEWMLIFVVKTALGAAPLIGAPVYKYQTYAACTKTAKKFNWRPEGTPPQQQTKLAVCESTGNQKPDGEDDGESPGTQ